MICRRKRGKETVRKREDLRQKPRKDVRISI